MLVVGLTGGIGSGKSLVAKLFAKRGITVIDADVVAREVTQTQKPALAHIAEEFGPDILQSDGSLDRNKLRKIIFNDETKRIWLEKLLHPLIRAEMKKQTETAQSVYCIVVIPLLLETEPNPLVNRILVVDTTEDLQIKRTQARDNATVDEIKAIIKTQIARPMRLALANDIIHNHGSLADLEVEVDRLHGFYTSLAQAEKTKASP